MLDGVCLCWGEPDVVELFQPGVLGDGAEDARDEAMAADLVLGVFGCEESKSALVLVLVLFGGCVVLEVRDLDSVAARELDDDDGRF
eukprot:3755643-Rhodomonas_salina.2